MSLSSHLGYQIAVTAAPVFKYHLFYVIMVPKSKSSDAGFRYAKRSYKVLPLSEKGNVLLDLIRKEKICMLRLLRPTGRTNLAVKL